MIDAKDKNWQKVRGLLSSIAMSSKIQTIIAMYVIPVLIAVIVNYATSNSGELKTVAFILLGVMAVFQIGLGISLLSTQTNVSPDLLTEVIENKDVIQRSRHELARKDESIKMLSNVYETLNTTTCSLTTDSTICSSPFSDGIKQILGKVTSNIRCTLNVSADQYTVECYLEYDALHESVKSRQDHLPMLGYLVQHYFHSPQQIDGHGAIALEGRSPGYECYDRRLAMRQTVEANKDIYFENGKAIRGLYFKRFACVPIYLPCNTEYVWGSLVITSMQDDEFSEDILSFMRFISSAISNYTYNYNKCVAEKEEAKKKEEQRQKRRESRKQNNSQSSAVLSKSPLDSVQ